MTNDIVGKGYRFQCVNIFVSKWNEIVERNEMRGNSVPLFGYL